MKIGSYIITLVLMVLIVFNSIRTSLTYAYFKLDPIGFIENLCENTDQPELKCNGKCQLKKVAETQNNDQNAPENIVDFKELILYPSPITDFVFLNKTFIKKQKAIAYQNLYSFHNSSDCFHPPRV